MLGATAWLLFGFALLLFVMREHRTLLESPSPEMEGRPDIGIPVRLRIPSLSIDVSIEPVALTKDGDMDMPRASSHAGWYRYAARPGQEGNSVIAGHFDTILSTRGIFYDLKNIGVHDTVIVNDDRGNEFVFRVESTRSLPYDDTSSLRDIFGPSPRSLLTLITCKGSWSWGRGTYAERLIVSTTHVDTIRSFEEQKKQSEER